VLGGRKRRRRGADFRDDLRRIDTETRYSRESLHGSLMHAQQGRELLIELLHVRLQEVEFRERHREQPAVEGVHVRRGPEGIAQLLWSGMQTRTAEGGDRGRIGLAAGDGTEHTPRTRAEQIRHQRRH
jgi:hypothetical protein